MESWKDNDPKRRTEYSSEEREIMVFLDGVEKKYGKRSATHIR